MHGTISAKLTAEAESLGKSIAESLFRIQVSDRTILLAAYRRHGLSPQQGALLWQLQPGQAMPMGAMAEQIGCEVANITGIVDRLERRGLIHRTAASDRRVKLLSFTRAGLELRAVLIEELHRAPRWLSVLEPHRIVELEAALACVAAAIGSSGHKARPRLDTPAERSVMTR